VQQKASHIYIFIFFRVFSSLVTDPPLAPPKRHSQRVVSSRRLQGKRFTDPM